MESRAGVLESRKTILLCLTWKGNYHLCISSTDHRAPKLIKKAQVTEAQESPVVALKPSPASIEIKETCTALPENPHPPKDYKVVGN